MKYGDDGGPGHERDQDDDDGGGGHDGGNSDANIEDE